MSATPVGATDSADAFSLRRQAQLREPGPVDRASLEVLGFILGGVTALVIATAFIVVRGHINTAVAVEHSAPVVPVALSPRR